MTSSRAGEVAARGAGRAIGAVVSALAHVRSVDKPMHPRGLVLDGRLRRRGGSSTGSPFLDEPGEDDVLVRFSRSLGWRAPWPDVNGLAVRVPTPAGPHEHADLLLSTTGRGRAGRYVLVPTVRERGGFLGTLVPFRSPTGAVHVGAQAVDDRTWELVWARPGSVTWTAFAVLELGDEPGRDLAISFDAVAGGLDGLEVPDWHRRVRGPSYAAARRSRGTTTPYDVG